MTISDLKQDGEFRIGRMESALFGCEVTVIIHEGGEAQLAYAEQCADYFNRMPAALLRELKRATLRYCEDMRRLSPQEEFLIPKDVSERTVFRYMRPNSLIVERPKKADVIAFEVEFSCDWEREHGLEWTIRGGEALYVGDYMGISPWYAEFVYLTECRSYVYEDFSMA